jgi:CheY-like chemotaxis protein
VRPVREQLEHDRVIRLLQAKYKRKFEVAINPGHEQTMPVGTGTDAWYPDLVLQSPDKSRKLLGVVEVETAESVNHLEAMSQWAALSADEGLALAQTHRPNAVILDLRMPLTSGLQFLRAIRAIPGLTNTPVAIVTGDYFLDDAQANEIQALGAQLRYKPLWLEELVTLARELLNIPVRD